MTNTKIIDYTTCKYGYEDEQLGIPMCHHPKRFSKDCVDFNMHEEKEVKESEKSINGLDVTDFCKPIDPGIAQCIADHSWEMLGEDEKPVPNNLDFEQELYDHFGQVKDFTLGMRIGKYFYELGCTRTAEQFEKNRLAACDNMSKEEYDRETDFVDSIIKNEHRQPTFSDAINYGMRLQKEEESVPPNDLEEAAKNIARDVCKQLPNGEEKDGIVYYAILAAIAGAKWHKEQNDKDLSEKIAAAYQLGLADKEKQMLKEARNHFVLRVLSDNTTKKMIELYNDEVDCKFGDVVRIIVLKKEDDK